MSYQQSSTRLDRIGLLYGRYRRDRSKALCRKPVHDARLSIAEPSTGNIVMQKLQAIKSMLPSLQMKVNMSDKPSKVFSEQVMKNQYFARKPNSEKISVRVPEQNI